MASYHVCIKSGKKGRSLSHSNYIAREGKYGKNGKDEDLLYKVAGNFPSWANGKAQQFWKMADAHERKNAAAYREIEIALPSELTPEQNIEILKKVIQTEIGNKPYQAAIHCPQAALGKVDQPHAHIMFSDRINDEFERLPEQHFRRFNRQEPAKGGCRKASGGKLPAEIKSELVDFRARLAELQNDALARFGHKSRVDHRSNEERGIEKEPERHLGQAQIRKMSEQARCNSVGIGQSSV